MIRRRKSGRDREREREGEGEGERERGRVRVGDKQTGVEFSICRVSYET